jgi:hypothetical protein
MQQRVIDHFGELLEGVFHHGSLVIYFND